MRLKQLLSNATLANQLTFVRLVAVPFFIIAVLDARFGLAFVLFVVAAITDLLDGLAARLLDQPTSLGAFLDPAADKLIMTAAFVLMADYPKMFQNIPMPNRFPVSLTVLAISRDVLIVLVALLLYLSSGVTRFKPTIWGKLTTGFEIVTICLYLLFNWLGRSHVILDVAWQSTLLLILISGTHYLWRTVSGLRSEGSAAGDG